MAAPSIVRGLLHPAAGPVIRILLHSEGVSVSGLAVLDTGASASVIDRQLARDIDLPSPGAAEWVGISANGQPSQAALRSARIEVVGARGRTPLSLIEVPRLRHSVPGLDILALLGWDFLSLCRLTCDGPAGAFTLELPQERRRRRR